MAADPKKKKKVQERLKEQKKKKKKTTVDAFVDTKKEQAKTAGRVIKRGAGFVAEKGLSGLIGAGKGTKAVLDETSKQYGITRSQKKVDTRTTKLIKEKYGKPVSKAELNKARAARRAKGNYGK